MHSENNIITNFDFFSKHGIYKKSMVPVVAYILTLASIQFKIQILNIDMYYFLVIIF